MLCGAEVQRQLAQLQTELGLGQELGQGEVQEQGRLWAGRLLEGVASEGSAQDSGQQGAGIRTWSTANYQLHSGRYRLGMI